jgi:hypothetical protein
VRSRNLSTADSDHLAAVKSLRCSLCDCSPPVEAHHIRQGLHFTCVALCMECHRGTNGWHGNKSLWRIRKMDELDALDITNKRLLSVA